MDKRIVIKVQTIPENISTTTLLAPIHARRIKTEKWDNSSS